jgi:hypothetical protein
MLDTRFNFNPRKWHRASVHLPAQYFIKGESSRYMDCTIITLSRSGAGVLFPLSESLKARSSVFFELIVPKTFEQLTVRGELKNKNTRNDGLVGGVEFVSLLPEEMFAKLA